MWEIPILLFIYWMLIYFFPKTKKKRPNLTLKIDLKLVAFPDYPISPQLELETIQEDLFLSRWQQGIAKWKEADGGKLWCVAINNWFINHEFNSKEEVKMAVTYWLVKVEEVVIKGCLKIDEINVIVKTAEILLLLDNNNSLFHLNDVFILMSIIADFIPNCKTMEEIEKVVVTKKAEKEILLKPQREVFETLKHNLEGIIEGNRNELLPIDAKNCELAEYFTSVCNDVREIWNELQNQSIEKTIQGTAERGKENKPNKTEKLGNASPEVYKGRDTDQKGSPEVLDIQSKVEHTEEIVPELNKGRDKVEHTEEVLSEVNKGKYKVEHTEEVLPEVNKGKYKVEHTEEVLPEVKKGRDKVTHTKEVVPVLNKGIYEEVVPEANTGRDEVERTEEVVPEVNKGRDKHTEEVLPEVNKGRDKDEHTEKVVPEVSKKRGKVPVLEYIVLQKYRVEMVNKLEPEKVIPYLIQYNVIDKDDVEMIENKCKDLRRKGAETMLDILYNSGSWAFKKYMDALLNAGYQEMAKTLEEDLEKKTADPQSINTTKQKGVLPELEFEVLRDNHERLVNELDSSVLKNHLFKNGVIDEDDLEKIGKKEEEFRKEGAEELVNIIHKSGANAFRKLLISLHDAGYDELSSKLDTDLKQKENERRNEGMKMDLKLVAFPDYPIFPQLSLEGDNDLLKNVNEWFNARDLWCVAMNYWFKDHEFNNKEEVKVEVKDWLLKLQEVVDREHLGIEVLTAILNLAEIILKPDDNNSPLHLKYNKEMLLKVIKKFIQDFESNKEMEELVQILKAKKQKKPGQQRQDFETLKHTLEGIIEGNQNKFLPFDTENCELAEYFPSVCNDVGEIWNKLQ